MPLCPDNTTAVPRKRPILPYFGNCAAKEALRLCPRPGGPRGLETEREWNRHKARSLSRWSLCGLGILGRLGAFMELHLKEDGNGIVRGEKRRGSTRTSLTASGFHAVGLTSLQQRWSHESAIDFLVVFIRKGQSPETPKNKKRMSA